MNYLSIELLSKYSLSTIIISVVTIIICGVLRLIFKNKLPIFFKNYLPMLLSVVIAIIVEIIIVEKRFTITEKAIYSGFASGSLSTLILVIITKIKRGEKITKSPLSLIIEGMLYGYIKQEKITEVTNSITLILQQIDVEEDKENAKHNVKSILLENLEEEISIIELDSIITMILGVTVQEIEPNN